MARPMPRLLPVTTAILSFNLTSDLLLRSGYKLGCPGVEEEAIIFGLSNYCIVQAYKSMKPTERTPTSTVSAVRAATELASIFEQMMQQLTLLGHTLPQ